MLRGGLSDRSAWPLEVTNREGSKFLLEKYSRRIYENVAPNHFNKPVTVKQLQAHIAVRVGAFRPSPNVPFRNLTVEKLERWISEAEPTQLRHTAAVIERVSLVPAARLLRLADMYIAGALMQLPLEALRAFTDKFKGRGWRRAAGQGSPVLTLRIEASSGVLHVLSPDPRLLCKQLLRHCVASLRGLTLPSEGVADALLDEHLVAQGTEEDGMSRSRRTPRSPRLARAVARATRAPPPLPPPPPPPPPPP